MSNRPWRRSLPAVLTALMASACAPPAGTTPGASVAAVPGAAGVVTPATTPATTPAAAAKRFAGTASVSAPLIGATVTLLGLDGTPLLPDAALKTTGPNGDFALEGMDLPADFRIVVHGGEEAGHAFEGELAREVRGWAPGAAPLAVDLATTLASAHAQAHPAGDLAASDKAVKAYLAIPEAVALGSAETARHFDGGAFMAATAAVGGFGAAVLDAVQQMDAGQTRPYLPVPASKDGAAAVATGLTASGAASWLGGNIASGAVGALGGLAMNHFLAAVGVPGDPAMAALNAKLDALLARVDALSTQVGVLSEEMRASLSDVQFQGKVDARLSPTLDKIRAIDLAVEELNKRGDKLDVATGTAAVTQATADYLSQQEEVKKRIRDRFPEPDVALELFRVALMGDGLSRGVITSWQMDVAARNSRYYNVNAANQVAAVWDFLDAAQAKLALYLLALATADKKSEADIRAILDRWQKNRVQELGQLRGMPADRKVDVLDLSKFGLPRQTTQVAVLPAGTILDVQNGTMWSRAEAGWTVWDKIDSGFANALSAIGLATGKYDWRVPMPNEIMALRKHNGVATTFAKAGMAPALDAETRVFWTAERWQGGGGPSYVPKLGFYLNRTESGARPQDRTNPRLHFKSPTHQTYVQVMDGNLRSFDDLAQWRPDWIHPDHWRDGMMILTVRTVLANEMLGSYMTYTPGMAIRLF